VGAAVQPREAAVADHRVADDRQRAQRRRRHRKRAAVKRPEVVVGGVGVLPVSTTRSVTMAVVSLEKKTRPEMVTGVSFPAGEPERT